MIGLSCASALLRAGHRVTVLETSSARDAASWGMPGTSRPNRWRPSPRWPACDRPGAGASPPAARWTCRCVRSATGFPLRCAFSPRRDPIASARAAMPCAACSPRRSPHGSARPGRRSW
ncbi:hypothetical protein [Sphingomonas sp. 7/4-4]|uniref:hypothetical protein n=1 Tax=Sphingomonas sp. 7/4-4 TaxID=3018446 RepID=UPI00300E4125